MLPRQLLTFSIISFFFYLTVYFFLHNPKQKQRKKFVKLFFFCLLSRVVSRYYETNKKNFKLFFFCLLFMVVSHLYETFTIRKIYQLILIYSKIRIIVKIVNSFMFEIALIKNEFVKVKKNLMLLSIIYRNYSFFKKKFIKISQDLKKKISS